MDEDAKDSEDDITFNVKRIEDKSVPGDLNPNDPIGVAGGKDDPVSSIGAASGFGGRSGRTAYGPDPETMTSCIPV